MQNPVSDFSHSTCVYSTFSLFPHFPQDIFRRRSAKWCINRYAWVSGNPTYVENLSRNSGINFDFHGMWIWTAFLYIFHVLFLFCFVKWLKKLLNSTFTRPRRYSDRTDLILCDGLYKNRVLQRKIIEQHQFSQYLYSWY